jgi:WhiB family redox-sensing transcriptional regulator
MEQGRCAHRPALTGLFFQATTLDEDHKPAKRICAACPVAGACLDYALVNNIDHGVWGGATESERRAIRRARAGRPPKAVGMRNARASKGLSQRDLAARVGIAQATVGEIERGESVPSPAVADRLVTELGRPLEALLSSEQLAEMGAR